jgi:hypothetical protein
MRCPTQRYLKFVGVSRGQSKERPPSVDPGGYEFSLATFGMSRYRKVMQPDSSSSQ